MSLLERKSLKGSDNFQTPDWPVELLVNKIKETNGRDCFYNKRVWEPACGRGNIVSYLLSRDIDAFGTDINREPKQDFLTFDPPYKYFDVIITNPPFSKKTSFLKKCYELKKPFALLLPYSTLETEARQELFKKNGLQVLFLPKRVDFEYEDGNFKKSPWFATAWFTWGFNFEKDMIFLD